MQSERGTRRLAAILSADVAGYSRLMEFDETATLRRLKSARDEMIDPTIREFGGRVVKTTGDGWLVEFPSAVDAVECAVTFQLRMAKNDSGAERESRLQFRVGVNLGDILIDGADVYGDGVNIAARLEGLAEPGGICISQIVRESIGNSVHASFEDGGEQELKNISRPIHVWRWSPLASSQEGAAPRSQPQRTPRPSIAVLPFENISGDPEQEYFADGLTEDLIAALARWRSFPVLAPRSTFTYKGKTTNVRHIANELGAAYVMEGSVRRSGKRIRITAQLVDGQSGHQVWAERYDRELDDVFDLQDELTRTIASILAPELTRAELQRSSTKRPNDLNAWDCFLRGEAELARLTPAGNRKARQHLERAISIEPQYSDAYSGLAMSHTRDVMLEACKDREISIRLAIEAAQRAIELDWASARAHHELSTAYIWQNRHDLALEEAHLAVKLNPNDALGLHMLGNKSDLAGDPKGLARMEEAQQLNPRDPQSHFHLSYLARAYMNVGRIEEAIEVARAAIHRRADYPNAHFILALALVEAGRIKEAREALDACEQLSPGFAEKRLAWRPYTDERSNSRFQTALQKIL